MKLNTIFVVIPLIAMTVYIALSIPAVEQKIILTHADVDLKTTIKLVNQNEKPLAVETNIGQQRAATTEVAFAYKSLWAVTDQKNEKPFPFQNPRQIDYRSLTLDRFAISMLKTGDQINFSIPQSARDYYGVISRVKLNDSGVNSYFGSLVNQNHQFSFIITQGPNSTYAMFNTPDGQYALESHAGDAWINDIQDERNTLDYSKNDIIKLTPTATNKL